MTTKDFYVSAIENLKKRDLNSKYTVDDIIVKARGINEYIYGDSIALIDYEYIRSCFEDGTLVELTIFEKEVIVNKGGALVPFNGSREKSYHYDLKKYNGDNLNGFSIGQEVISCWELTKKPLRLFIEGISGPIVYQENNFYYVVARLFYGHTLISQPQVTDVKSAGSGKDLVWGYQMIFDDMYISDLPREAHLQICVMYCSNQELEKQTHQKEDSSETNSSMGSYIGHTTIYLFDHKNALRSGPMNLRLWNEPPAYNGIIQTSQNPSDNAIILKVEFDYTPLPVVFPEGKKKLSQKRIPTKQLDYIITRDCLMKMSEREKLLVWNYREHLIDTSIALPKLLNSVDWFDYSHISEVYRLLKEWTIFEDPQLALELLDIEYQDRNVREFASQILERISDSDLSNMMLQLVEIIKYELNHFSPFTCFILKRAIKSPHLVGYKFFWALKSQMENEKVKERFSLLIEEYLRCCSKEHKSEIEQQMFIVNELLRVASVIANQPKSTKQADLNIALHKLLKDLKLPNKFTTPLNYKVQCSDIIIPKCKVMSSKKRPLKLAFKNSDESGDDVVIFFKAGDDLRQDELTLQMLRIMDSLWFKQGLDLHINAYDCVSTSKNCGMISCVPNSTTIACLSQGLNDTMAKETILNWINKECRTQELISIAIENFKNSCAGYLVATHVLGIGDRHNDNIMITTKGDLFHIDFGHFLGHRKKIGNIERENTPFVFTKAYAHVLGGPENEKFKELQVLTGKAFNILRQNGNLLMILFKLMLHCGIPELESSKDIEWIREKLVLDMSEKEASDHFCSLFIESMSNKRQLVMDAVHYWKHHL